MTDPELEHIAPQTAPEDPVAAGYCEYDEEFRTQYLDCLGNYLLASKSHNCSIGNIPFKEKRKSYETLFQHREVRDMTEEEGPWNKEKISLRKNKLIRFVLDNF
jgi:hypothetical protein